MTPDQAKNIIIEQFKPVRQEFINQIDLGNFKDLVVDSDEFNKLILEYIYSQSMPKHSSEEHNQPHP